MKNDTILPPAKPIEQSVRQQHIVDWWIALQMSGDAGPTTWEVLDPLAAEVTACLILSIPNLDEAERLTAQALLLMQGGEF